MKNIFEEIPDFANLIANLVDQDGSERDEWLICCPFPDHNDQRPSFSIRITDGVFHCHACDRSGNIIILVRDLIGLSSSYEAVQYIRKYYHKETGGKSWVLKP